ncbi:MAG: hypothetical protein JNL75_10875 [Chitinophagales bacterium]|nr:hypothetical protein [Chitinophagales bacterium]
MDIVAYWSKLITIFLFSIVKYGLGLFTAINLDTGIIPSILANLAGGAIGLLIFINFGSFITKKYYEVKYRNNTYHRFNRWNKFLVKVRRSMGLFGISFLSPILLTLPVGAMLALQITDNKTKIFIYMFSCCIFWSSVFFFLSLYLDINLYEVIMSYFT